LKNKDQVKIVEQDISYFIRKKTHIYILFIRWRIYLIISSLMIKGVIILVLAVLAASIPYEDQMTLANSLIVGRDDYSDLYNWDCKVCDSTNKPVHTHPI
jgi:hypothetical protein